MNKVFTKIAGLSVGLALAIGVGVAVGSRSDKVAEAVYVPEYTLDGTITGSGSQYAGDNSITQSGVEWIVNGNISMNPWRIGGKKVTSPSTVTDYVRLVKSNATVSQVDFPPYFVKMLGNTQSIACAFRFIRQKIIFANRSQRFKRQFRKFFI